MRIHVVQRGDTLWRLAQMYGTTINQISFANRFVAQSNLVVGESLVIPTPIRDYVVEPGDSLADIARRFDVALEDLMEANNISDPNVIFVGRMLHLPYFSYVINPGDTLYELAQRYRISVDQINTLNALQENATIYPGQMIKIPRQHKESTEINAYTTNFDQQGRNEVIALGSYFTYLSSFSYGVSEDGNISELHDQLILDAATLTNTTPLLVLTNFRNGTFNSDLAAAILRNSDVQMTLIRNLLSVMEDKGYQGVNIDFEYVYPEDRENYNAFLRRVVEELHPNYSVSTALAPKESR